MVDSGLRELKGFPKNTIYSNLGQAENFVHQASIRSLADLRINLKYEKNHCVPNKQEDNDLHLKKKHLLSLLLTGSICVNYII